ncbi:MAG: hypothetical protein ABI683_13495 [Ginsengibacter sp.]
MQYTGRRGNNGLQVAISNSSSAAEVNQLLLLSSFFIYKSSIVPADVFQMPVRKAVNVMQNLPAPLTKLYL